WIVLQRRTFPFDLSFNRPYQDYKDGFGDLKGEFWLGLEKMHQITSDPYTNYKIAIEFWTISGKRLAWEATNFRVAGENAAYQETSSEYN
ncbi:hypothetical protein CAPTEDRAFT_27765, partial [Capitella teleta]